MPTRLTILAVLTLAGALPARADIINQIIRNNCVNAVTAEFREYGQQPPEGMVDYTCDCVVQKIRSGSSISSASAACKSQAVTRFGL
jgi:hypothetical protein